jgi:hypothetical protein
VLNVQSGKPRRRRCKPPPFTLSPNGANLICFLTLSGFNNVPKSTNIGGYENDTPKGATRILNSLQTQQAFHQRKKAESDGSKPNSTVAKGKGKASIPKILPGESLGEYNRRLEDHLRPEVAGAIKAAAAKKAADEKEIWMQKKANREAAKEAKARKERGEPAAPVVSSSTTSQIADKAKGKRKSILDDSDSDSDGPQSGKKQRKTEFDTLPARKSLNDIVQAPPSLPGLKRLKNAKVGSAFSANGRTPLNAGQKRLMEEERERVIARYRELKETKIREREVETGKSLKTPRRRPDDDEE